MVVVVDADAGGIVVRSTRDTEDRGFLIQGSDPWLKAVTAIRLLPDQRTVTESSGPGDSPRTAISCAASPFPHFLYSTSQFQSKAACRLLAEAEVDEVGIRSLPREGRTCCSTLEERMPAQIQSASTERRRGLVENRAHCAMLDLLQVVGKDA